MKGDQILLETREATELTEEYGLQASDDWRVGSQLLRWGKRKNIHYQLYALIHPINLFMVMGFLAIGLIDGIGWLAPSAITADLLLTLGVLPRFRAFRNLVENGVKYTSDRGRVTIRLSIRQESA